MKKLFGSNKQQIRHHKNLLYFIAISWVANILQSGKLESYKAQCWIVCRRLFDSTSDSQLRRSVNWSTLLCHLGLDFS